MSRKSRSIRRPKAAPKGEAPTAAPSGVALPGISVVRPGTTPIPAPIPALPLPVQRTSGITLTRVSVVDPDPDPSDGPTPAATSSGAEIRAGQQVMLALQATLQDIFGNDLDDVLQLAASGLPPQATCTISPNPVHTFTEIDITLQTALDTPPGDYTVSFTGQSLNIPSLTYGPYTFALKVDPPVRKVVLTIPPAGSALPGRPAAYPVGIRRRHLPGASVSLKADISKLPAGTTMQFVPNPTTADASGLTLVPPASAAPGTYPFTVTGTVGVEGATPGTAASTLVVAAPMLAVAVVNRLLPNDPVAISGCPVELRRGGQTVARATTNRFGNASVSLAGVADGTYDLLVTPRDSTTAPVGPDIGAAQPQPDRIWRPLTASLTLRGGAAVAGSGVDVSDGAVTARLQPVFIKSPNTRQRTQALTLCVVHKTDKGGTAPRATIQSTLNAFLTPGGLSSHYIVDRDGQIVKMVHESAVAFQAGCSQWLGQDGVNEFSIGIEQVHDEMDGSYPDVQVNAVVDLLKRVLATPAYSSIPARGVVGHSDVATTTTQSGGCFPTGRKLGRKGGDPGREFDWKKLRDEKLGILLNTAAPTSGIYGGFFDRYPGGSLRRGDNDASHLYGGMANTGITANVIAELQADLRAIGYFCSASGTYDAVTAAAVQQFQDHFFSAGFSPAPTAGAVDRRTAVTVKQAR